MAKDQRIPKSLIIFGLLGSSKVQASRLKLWNMSCNCVAKKKKKHSHKRRAFQGNLGRCDVALTRLRMARLRQLRSHQGEQFFVFVFVT